eukprot:snap_masked-scaffold_1-processed-gene-29.30-mRNA-1 protein AED:1.00 eAED:1.00 QI:0/0/0/0/1/1/2/0/459
MAGRFSITSKASISSEIAEGLYNSAANRVSPKETKTSKEVRQRVKFLARNAFQADNRPLTNEELMMLPLVFIRVALLTFIFLLQVISYIVSAPKHTPNRGYTDDELGKHRSLKTLFSYFYCKILGVQIVVKGAQAEPSEAGIIVIGPHTSFLDSVVMTEATGETLVAFISKPFLPKFLQDKLYSRLIFVDRDDSKSRSSTGSILKERAMNANVYKQQILLFPEGTCSNKTALLNFSNGAFRPGLSVQPALIKYDKEVAWCSGSGKRILIFYRSLSQLTHKVEVDFMPVYTPSEEEKKDEVLFRENVRGVMSKSLGLPMCKGAYVDRGLALLCSKSKVGKSIDPAKLLDFYFEEVCEHFEVIGSKEKKVLLKQIQGLLYCFVSVVAGKRKLLEEGVANFFSEKGRTSCVKFLNGEEYVEEKERFQETLAAFEGHSDEVLSDLKTGISFKRLMLKVLDELY